MRVMLHACCGPCSMESTRVLAEEGFELALSYDNCNIYPPEEYAHRLQTLRDHVAEPQGIPLHEGVYDPEVWEQRVGVFGTDRPARCRACYALRLERAAARAADLGYEGLSTTLTISPYQLTDVILEELEHAAARHGLTAICRDFRPYYRETTRRSRAAGMYRQNYCGCRFSIAEAAAEREQARRQREAEKARKHRALVFAAAEGCVNQPSQL